VDLPFSRALTLGSLSGNPSAPDVGYGSKADIQIGEQNVR
jgi:hypothetical protein